MPSYSFRHAFRSFLQADHLHFADVLPEDNIERVFAEEGGLFAQDEECVFNPVVTLWAFLSQVLYKGEHRSCRAAVLRVTLWLAIVGRETCSSDTAAYCRARAKLPVKAIHRLASETATQCEQRTPQDWLWKGRHVYLVDGTTVTAADTEANQAEFPQPTSQQPGLGFPIIRVVVILSLATAMVGNMAMGPYSGKETGETALLRELLAGLQPGSILLADRYYCSYFLIALLQELDIAFVVRLHQRRRADFRRGQRLGRGDHIVQWQRPDRPEWMDEETYARMPETIRIRELLVQVDQPGFRVESFVVVSTLTAADTYSRDDLAELYHKRWLVELDIRTIKDTLGLDVLRCKSPAMVRRELWTGLLAYNLIRQTLLEAVLIAGKSPRQLSFTAALQSIAAAYQMLQGTCQDTLEVLIHVQLTNLAKEEVGDRPNRVEPRKVKRRPKPHPLLTKPREQARVELLNGREQN